MLHWQVGSLSLSRLGSPFISIWKNLKILADLISLIQTTSFSQYVIINSCLNGFYWMSSGFHYFWISSQTWPNLSVGIRIILFSMKVKAYYSFGQILGLDHLFTPSNSHTAVCGECVCVLCHAPSIPLYLSDSRSY